MEKLNCDAFAHIFSYVANLIRLNLVCKQWNNFFTDVNLLVEKFADKVSLEYYIRQSKGTKSSYAIQYFCSRINFFNSTVLNLLIDTFNLAFWNDISSPTFDSLQFHDFHGIRQALQKSKECYDFVIRSLDPEDINKIPIDIIASHTIFTDDSIRWIEKLLYDPQIELTIHALCVLLNRKFPFVKIKKFIRDAGDRIIDWRPLVIHRQVIYGRLCLVLHRLINGAICTETMIKNCKYLYIKLTKLQTIWIYQWHQKYYMDLPNKYPHDAELCSQIINVYPSTSPHDHLQLLKNSEQLIYCHIEMCPEKLE